MTAVYIQEIRPFNFHINEPFFLDQCQIHSFENMSGKVFCLGAYIPIAKDAMLLA